MKATRDKLRVHLQQQQQQHHHHIQGNRKVNQTVQSVEYCGANIWFKANRYPYLWDVFQLAEYHWCDNWGDINRITRPLTKHPITEISALFILTVGFWVWSFRLDCCVYTQSLQLIIIY